MSEYVSGPSVCLRRRAQGGSNTQHSLKSATDLGVQRDLNRHLGVISGYLRRRELE